MNERLIQIIEQKFNCRVISFYYKQKNLFHCKTNRGVWIIKSYRNVSMADWVTRLCHQLIKKGFPTTINYKVTRQNQRFFLDGDQAFTVMSKINGRHASFQKDIDLKTAISCLARFHRVAVGIEGAPGPAPNENPLLNKWKKRTFRFENIVRQLKQKNNLSDTEKHILSMAPYLIKDAYEVIDILERSPLQEKVHQAVHQKRVAHRDLASHNFIIGPNKNCYLIDYDTAMYDSPLVDIIQMLGRIMAFHHWEFDTYANLIAAYERIQPLTNRDRSLIYTLLRFPDDLMREVNGCYHDEKGFHSRNLGFIVRTTRKSWQKREEFFQGAHYFLTVQKTKI